VDVLGREWEPIKLKRPRREKKLPVVLSRQEVKSLLDVTRNLKHKAIFATAYSSGLRIGEVNHLKFSDIDGQRMQIRINGGKGNKTRITLLSPKVLGQLREYYKIYRPVKYLFEGRIPGKPICYTTIRVVFRNSFKKAGISKPVCFHSLRHSFATHMLEQGTNLRVIQQLLGHHTLKTTSVYLHISRFDTAEINNPIDNL